MSRTIRVTIDDPYITSYPKDIERIVGIFAAEGLSVTKVQVSQMWQAHSDSWCAGWLHLDKLDDAEILDNLKDFYEIV